MNDYQKKRFSRNIVKTLYNTVSGKKITLLGWAFKKDTNDTRESPAISVATDLILEQAKVIVYDPKVEEIQVKQDLINLNEQELSFIQVAKDPYEACKSSHAIAVLTEWDEFALYDWEKIYANMLKPAFVFDGRNVLDKENLIKIGFTYFAVGS